MAKKRGLTKKNYQEQRGKNPIFRQNKNLLLLPFSKAKKIPPRVRKKIPETQLNEDRRLWRPDKLKAVMHDKKGNRIRYRLLDRKKDGRFAGIKARLGFQNPLRVTVCDKRRQRRHTLFALAKIGKGKGSGKPRRYNEYSKIRC